MSIDFTILCTRSPAYFLRKRGHVAGWKRGKGQIGGLSIVQRKVEAGDPLPEDDYEERVVAVIAASGKLDDDSFDTWVDWSEALAEATRGAIFSHAADEFSYVWAEDPRPFMREWTQARLAAGEIDAIVARMNRAENSDRRMYFEHEAMRDVILAALSPAEKPAKKTGTNKRANKAAKTVVEPSDPVHVGKLVSVLYDHNEYDTTIQRLVLDFANRPDATDAVHVRAKLILDNRQRELDERVPAPATTTAVRKLYEGVVAGDASSERRYRRFVIQHAADLRAQLVAALVEGWNPKGAVGELVTKSLTMAALTDAERKQLEQLDDTDVLAKSLRDTARQWRADAGKRASEYSLTKYKDYERYRNEALVATPRRDRGMDTALFRPLNDALYGPSRSRPQLPEAIIVMICDRRFDEARAAYTAELGAEHADAAIRDAIEYFAPDRP